MQFISIALFGEEAVEWTITIEGKNEFGDVCRREMRITKSWESLFDGDIGLSIAEGKKIMAMLQSADMGHEEIAVRFRRIIARWRG